MKKIIFRTVLLVIIPLLVAFGIGAYAYKRYQGEIYYSNFTEYYLKQVGYKNTEEENKAYIKFISANYDVYKQEEIKNEDGKKLADLTIYRWFNYEGTKENPTKLFKYVYVLYNVNYGNIYYTIYPNSPERQFNGFIPTLTVKVTDKADEEINQSVNFSYNQDMALIDYGFVGYTTEDGVETKKFKDGTKITGSNTYSKWAAIDYDNNFSKEVKVEISATDAEDPTHEDANKTVYTLEINDYVNNVKSYNPTENTFLDGELEVGYNGNIKECGYSKYVFTKFIWWECLIAIVLTEIVTGSTMFIWENELKEEKKKDKKKAA